MTTQPRWFLSVVPLLFPLSALYPGMIPNLYADAALPEMPSMFCRDSAPAYASLQEKVVLLIDATDRSGREIGGRQERQPITAAVAAIPVSLTAWKSRALPAQESGNTGTGGEMGRLVMAASGILFVLAVLGIGGHSLYLMRMNARLRTLLEKQKVDREALQHERTVIKSLMESSPVGITVVDGSGRITFANPKAVEVLGLERGQIEERSYNAPDWHITDLDGNPIPDPELPFQKVMSTGKSVNNLLHAIEWPHGKRILLSVNAAPLLDESGQSLGMVAAISDITERKRAEDELQKSEEKFSKVFLACPEAISIASMENGRYIDVNEAFLRKTGFARTEVIGHTSKDLNVWIDEKDRQRFIEDLSRNGSLRNFEAQYRMKSGEVRTFLVSAETILLDGKQCSLNFIFDVTESKQAQEESRKQIEELAAWHQVTIGRETRVLELKSEVNELLTKLDQPLRY